MNEVEFYQRYHKEVDKDIIIDEELKNLFIYLKEKDDKELKHFIYRTSGEFLEKIERELPKYKKHLKDESEKMIDPEIFKGARERCVKTIVKNLIENENEEIKDEDIKKCLAYKDILGVFNQLSDLNASKDTPPDIKNRIDSIIERLLNAMNSEKGERAGR